MISIFIFTKNPNLFFSWGGGGGLGEGARVSED